MGTGRDGGEVEDGGGGGAASAATAVGEKAEEGEEDEEEHEGGADADANELPEVEAEDDGALVRVRHRTAAAKLARWLNQEWRISATTLVWLSSRIRC